MSTLSGRSVSLFRLVLTAVFCVSLSLSTSGTAAAQVSPLPGISTVAGNHVFGYSGDGGPATSASLSNAAGIAIDGAGNQYIADTLNHVIRKVNAAGTISTVAGTGTAGYSGDGGPATSATLNTPVAVTLDGAGNLYIADSFNYVVRKVDPSGTISTVAGNGTNGYTGDGGPATSAKLSYVDGIAVDRAGNLYIADWSNSVVRKVNPSGTISTVAGNGTQGYSGDGGPATSSQLSNAFALAVDRAGNLYIADVNNNAIRKVNPSGTINTVAGNGTQGYSGDGGPATSAALNNPYGVAVDGAGNVYIADYGNNVIRKVNAAGTISTVAGNGIQGYSGDGGPAVSAQLADPIGVTFDNAGNLYIADFGNSVVRKLASASTFPSTAVGSSSQAQNLSFQLGAAQSITSITAVSSQGGKQEYAVGAVSGCVVDGSIVNASGSICTVPVTFTPGYPGQRNVPLKIITNTGTYSVGLSGMGVGPLVAFTPGIISTVAGNGTSGYTGDAGPATSAQLFDTEGVAVDSAGNLYIADGGNAVIRKVDSAGTISTVAGNGTYGYSGDGGAATTAQLSYPQGIAVDSAGNLYIADVYNFVIRKVNAAGMISTVAGNGTVGYSGDGGPAISAQLNYASGLAVDGAGNLYIADTANNVIRKVDPSGIISTVAGNGTQAYSGDGGPATSATLNQPFGVAVDGAGNLYIADWFNNVIRKVNASGTISTVAGSDAQGYSGDGGPATSAAFNYPKGIAVDSAGNLYIADSGNTVVRKVSAAGTISTVAGMAGTYDYSGDGGPATSAAFNYPNGIAVDSAGNLYVPDTNNQVVRKVDVSTSSIRFATPTNAGSIDTADGPQNVVLSNIGNADLHTPVLGSGSNPAISANFTLQSCSQITAPGVLSAGQDCNLSVTFAPQSVGSITGSLVVTDGDLATHTVALSGTGLAVPPTISFFVPDHTFGDSPFAVTATSNSSGAITYAVVSGPATISGNVVTIAGAGTVVLSATQAASGNYAAATVSTSFSVLRATPTLSFSVPDHTFGDAPFAVAATSNSSGAITYFVSGPATISGNVVTLTGTGTVVLIAIQAASGNYAAATVMTSFNVLAGTPAPSANFSLSVAASGSSVGTVQAGGTATYNLVMTPNGNSTYPNAVNLSATGLPAGATATFSPATIPARSGATPFTLTIRTASLIALNSPYPTGSLAMGIFVLPLVGLRRMRRRFPMMLLAMALSLGAIAALGGCGGSAHSIRQQSSQTYTVKVIATDAVTGAQSSTNVTLTVQ